MARPAATVRPPARPLLGWWDLAPALPLLAVGLLGTGPAAAHQVDGRTPDAVAYTLVVVASLALLLRRRAARVALTVVALATSAYLILGFPYGPILLTGPAAAYAVGSRVSWRQAVLWCAGFVAVRAATVAVAGPADAGWLDLLAAVVVIGTFATLGAALQVRRRSLAGMRIEQARRAVSEERLQMAQDLHDGVGHGLAVIAMHAGVALHVLDRDPAHARELLTAIQTTSREALDGLRTELDRWRAADDAAARRPVPGLADLPQLLARMRAGGLVLHQQVADCPDGVPEEVGAAAYRIVQESLTNVLRHAGDTTATVRVNCAGGLLVVEVRDRGSRAPDPGGVAVGSGIAGMQQRAAAVGGRVHAGPVPGGGFVVRAELPLQVPAGAFGGGGTR